MARRAPRDRRPVLEELEAQVLYSADALGGLDTVLVANQDESVLEASPLAGQSQSAEVSAAQVATPSEHFEQVRREIVFVDADTDNYQQLLDDLTRNSDGTRQFDVYVLDNTRDGIEQINTVLAGYTDLDAMHIIAHADDAVLDLGGSQLDRAGLNAHATEIAGWADAFSDRGDVLIYGCDLAATADGQALVDSLATLTGTDVAASTDLTGAAALGGDWELEYTAGKVETGVAVSRQAQQDYDAVMDLPGVNDAPVFDQQGGSFDFVTSVDGAAVVLDADVTIFDAELSGLDDFDGATLTLARNGGASGNDAFSATGTLGALTQGGGLVVDGTTIGTVNTNSGGTLVLAFNANATNALVDSAMQQIAYSNSGDAAPASVQIDWAFDDGNTGAQGSGGALTATGTTVINITSPDAPTGVGGGIELNTDGGNDAYLIADDGGALLGGASELTVEVRFSTESTDRVQLFSYNGDDARDGLYLAIEPDGTMRIIMDGDFLPGISGIDYNTLRDGDIHSVALSWDNTNGNWAIYVDGALTDSGTGLATGGTLDGSAGVGELVFGQELDSLSGGFESSEIFAGTYYDVRIWNEVRSEPEIALQYQNRFDSGNLPAGLIANWQMDGLDGANEVVDVVSGNNLSIAHVLSTPVIAIDGWTGQNGGASANGNTITFLDQGRNGWDSEVNSVPLSSLGFTDNYTVSFRLDNLTNFGFFIGLGAAEESDDIWDVDYSMYFDHNSPGMVATYREGVAGNTANLSYVAGDEFSFYVNGTTIEYQHNGVTFYTATGVTPGTDLYVDSSFLAGIGSYVNQDDYSLSTFTVRSGNAAVSEGYLSSTPIEGLHVSENADTGTSVGFVVPNDPNVVNDLVVDGLFTEGPDPGYYSYVSAGQTFGDWAVRSGSINVLGTYAEDSPLGGNSVELSGLSAGGIYQTLNTTPGVTYQVVFALSGNWNAGEATKDLRVSAAGQSEDYAVTRPDGWSSTSNMMFSDRSFTFTATGSTTDLDFLSLDAGDYASVIADVRVYEIPAAVQTILNNDATLSYDAATDKFYRLVNSLTLPVTAIDEATSSTINGVAGQLATIRSAYENDLILGFAQQVGGDILLGGRDATSEGDWYFLDGSNENEQFSNGSTAISGYYTNWQTGQPNGSTSENHLALATDGSWHDISDGQARSYVIEWDASEVLSNFTFALSDDASGRFSIDSNSGEITVANGSLLDYETATSHNVIIEVTDATGNAYSEIRTVAVDNVQEPAQTVPGPQAVDINEVLTFSAGNAIPNAVTVSDTLIGTDSPMQVQLAVNDGVLNLSGLSGITMLDGAQGSSSMTITGLESDINAALEGMTFTPTTNFNGSVSLDVSTAVATTVAGLEGHYTFEGGNALNQSAVDDHDGTLNGGATTAIDLERGEVLSLTASGDNASITGLLGEPANVTLAAWVNLTAADTMGSEVISLGDSVALRLQSDGTNAINGFFYNGAGWDFVEFDVGSSLVGAGWHHVAFSFNDVASTATLYLDGVEVSSTSVTSSINYSLGANTMIGAHGNSNSDRDFTGLIDDARVYTRAISADEVAALAADRAAITASVDITVAPINDAPTFGNLDGNPTYIEDGTAVVLDADVTIFDQELTALNDFGGATLTLARAGGANSDDLFSATGTLGFNAGTLELAATNVGSYTNTNGTLTLTFGANVTNAQVNAVMQSIAYANSNDSPPTSVQIEWTFNDGNAADAQGSGSALTVTGSTNVDIIDVSNDASLVVPIAQSVDEDAPLTFSTAGGNAISLDSGSSDNPVIAVTLAVSNGSLTLGTTANITFVAGTNDGDATVTFYGTESAVNVALDGLQYQGDPDYSGGDSLTVTTGSSAATEANLYARYEFGNGALIDQSGNGYNGTLVGDPTLTNDPDRGDVMTFDGDDRIEVAGGVAALGDQVTFSAWVNLDAGQQDAVFLSIGDEFWVTLDRSFSSYSMGVHARGFTTNSLSSANNIAGEGWNHVAATLNDTTNQLHLYLNGVLVTSSSGAFDFGDIDWGNPDSPNITIGSMSDGSDAFVGSIDDVRVYNAELSESEILAILGDHGDASDTLGITVDAVNDAPVYTALPASNEAVIDDSVFAPSVLTSGDFDNDGHADLIGATSDGQILLYTNDGNGGFSSGNELFNTVGYDFRSIATGDLDGDGDLDFVVTNQTPDGSEDGILIFDNQYVESGSMTFTMTSMESTSFDAYDVAIADIDGDTRLDIVASFQSGEVVLYEQNTADVFTRTSIASVAGARGIDVGDVDGDGSLDVAVAGSGGVYWLENDSAASPSFTVQTALTLSDIADVSIAQLNGGADADIAYFRDYFFGSQIGWLESDGGATPAFTQQVISPLQNFNTFSTNLVAADIDNSGSVDLVLGRTSADQVVIFGNDGSGTFTEGTRSLTPDGPAWVEAADLDGDGDLELLYAQSGDSSFSVHVNRGAGVYTTINANEDTTLTGLRVQIGDVDAGASDLSVTLNVTNGGVTIATGGVTFASGISTGSSVTFTGTLTEINTALNSFSFTPDADYFGAASIAIAVNDLGNTGSGGAEVANETLVLHVQPVNDAPGFQGVVNAHSGPENATFTPFDTDTVIADNDSGDFNGGALTISSGSPGSTTDQLQILAQGNLTLTGSEVRVSGIVIGAWAGGENGTDLTVNFNVNADVSAVNEVLHSIRYDSTDDTPSSSPSITAVVTDGDGGASPVLNADITLIAENDAPTFIALDGSPTFVEGGVPVVLDANAQIFDAELSELDDFNGATLVLGRDGAPSADDVFSATGTLSALTQGANLVVAGTNIGTVTTNSAGTLALTFNSNATNALVDSTLQQIAYVNSNNVPPASVQINWTFDDGNAGGQGSGGARTATGSTTVSILPAADLSITAPATVATNEDTVLVYSGANVISVDDGIAADTPTRVTLSVTNGSVTLADLTGITIVEGADGSSAMVIEGLESDINGALDGLRFTPNSNDNGSDTLTISTAIAAGLEGHYTFENGNANDQSAGTAINGTLTNNATIESDAERGDVLRLDGNDDDVTINSLFDNPASVTLASWINVQSYDTDGSVVMSLGENVLIWLNTMGQDVIVASYLDGTDWNEIRVPGESLSLIGSGWHHIAYTVDDAANTQTLYLNGQAIGQTNYTESISYTTPNSVTRIGGHAGTIGSRDFDGLIDEARVYTRVLSAEEIAALATDQTEATTSVAITVDAVNDAPVVTAPGSAYSFTEQGSLNIHGTGFSVADIDDNGGAMTATFTVGEGRVLIDAGDSGVVLTSGNFVTSGNSTDTVTFTGTQAQINALLDGSSTGTIVYYHDQTAQSDTPSVSTAITLTVNDQGNTGADPGDTGDAGSEEHSASQTINITAVNDAPNLYGQNLIANGTFTDGLSEWAVTGTVSGASGRAALGTSNSTGPHSASQSVATSAGETYVLEFDYRDGHANLNQQLQVTVDGASNLLTTEQIVTDTDGTEWVRYRFTFTADSAAATVTFTDTSDSAGSNSASTFGSDGAIDNVSVRQSGGQLGSVVFTEDGSAVILDGAITLFDAEIDAALDDFDGTTLTLARNGGPDGDDVFSGSGNLVLSGGAVQLSAASIGSYSDTGGQLVISFNDTANSAQINEVLQSIAYSNTSDTPPASVQIDWIFDDANAADAQGSGPSLAASGSTVVNITAANDAPVLTVNPGGGTYNENTTGTYFDTALTIGDVDSSDFDGGQVTVSVSGSGEATDRLAIRDGGSVSVVGSDVRYDFGSGPVVVATVAGGTGHLDPLVVTFNGQSDATSVQAVARQVAFSSISDAPSTAQRTLEMAVTDGDGGASAAGQRVMNVIALNDAAVVDLDANDSVASGLDFAAAWTEGAGAVLIVDSDASLVDPDSSNLQSITITISNLLDGADEVLSADTTGTGVVASYDSINGMLTLSGNHSLADYQQVLRTVTYDNSAGAPDETARTITFVANDGIDPSAVATTTLSMTGVNNAAAISGDTSFTGDEGDTVGGDMDATDADGLNDGTYFTVTSAATNGTALIDPETGVWTFAPTDPDWFGSDSFTVTVTDDLGGTTEQVVNVTLANVDDAAVITGDVSYTGDEGDTVGGDMDASDIDGLTDGTYFTVSAAATNGTAAIDPETGVWTFTPTDPNWHGSDSFTVTVTDDLGGTTEQVVNVTLANVDDAALITGDVSYTGDEGDTVGGDMDATDIDGLTDGTYFTVSAAATNGTAAIDSETGVWTFAPTDPNWFGSDSFTVTVTDDLGGTTEQVVSITLANVDDASVITGDVSYAGDEGDTVGGDMDATDVDGLTDGTYFTVTSAATNGTAAIDSETGVWTFAPTDPNWFGSDSFTVTVTDDLGGTTEQVVNVTLANVDDAAVITGDVSYTGDEGDTVGGDMDATDVDGLTDGTYFTVTSAATNGTAAIDPETGVWTFTPTDPNWFGSDSFTVTVTDDLGGTTEQVVNVTLANVDDAALITGDVSYTGDEGDTVGGDMDATDIDGLTDGTYFTVTSAGTNGTAAIDPETGVWTFTPTDPNWFGSDSFTVTVTDDLGGTTEQIVTVTLATVDDSAVITGDVSYTGDEGDTVGGDMDASDIDGLTDGTYFTVSSAATNGTAAINPETGVWTFTPTDPNWHGSDSFTVTVTDDLGGTTEQVVNVTLANVDDEALITGDVSYTGGEGDTVGGDMDATDVDGLTDGTYFAVSAAATNGTAAINPETGVWTFTPTDPNWHGSDSFTVTVTDDLGGTTEQVVNVTLANVDDAAVITGDVSYTGDEGDTVGGDMDATDVDGLTDGTYFTVTSAATNGTAAIDPETGVWTFTPTDPNWFGADSFTVTITDDLGGTTEQLVNVTLVNVDDAALITGDASYTGDEGDTVGGDMDATDADGLNDGTYFTVTSAATNGTAAIDPETGVWTFAPTDPDWFGSDSFTVTVTDDLGGTTEQIVTVTLATVDDSAVITGDVSYTGDEGDTVGGDMDASDIDGLTDGTYFTVSSAATNGTAAINPETGVWTFTPTDPNWHGSDSFTVTVTDDLGGTTEQVVNVTLANVDDEALITGDVSYTGGEGDTVGGDMDATDVDGLTDGTYFAVSAAATNGTAAINPETGVWTFTPTDPNWHGSDSFTVTVTDDLGGTTEQIVNVTLATVDDSAVITGDVSYTGDEGDTVGGDMDASDIDGLTDGTYFTVSAAATNGTAAIDPETGVWTFTPTDPNWHGSDSFTVTVTDDLGGTTEQIVNVTLANVDDAAVITGDVSYTGDEGDTVGGDMDASDIDGLTDGTYFTVTSAATNGTAAIDPETGVWTFTPTDPNWFGTDSFTVTVTDDLGGATEQVVSITLANVDDASVITGDVSYAGDEGDTVGGDMGATDVDGLTDGTYFTVTSAATNGTAAIDPETGVWTFAPTDPNWFGSDSFTVTVTDDLGGTTEQVVSITLANVDDASVITGDVSYAGDEGDTVGGDMDATDVDGLTDGTYFTVTSAATNGTALIDPETGVWTFTPTDSNWFGADSFTVTVTDDLGGTTEQIVNVTLANVGDAPLITGDVSYTGDEGDAVGGDMDATDIDGMNDGTYFTVTSAATSGTTAIDPATGVWSFTPSDPEWFGTDSFTVNVTDDRGDATEQVVNITLANVDDAAVITGDISASGNAGDTLHGDLDATDADGLNDGSIFTVVTPAANGTAVIDPGSGAWIYVPDDPGWSGADQFTVAITDDQGGTANQLVSLSLAAAGDAPILEGVISGTITEDENVVDGQLVLRGVATIADSDPGESTMRSNVAIGSYGNLTNDANGAWVYVADNASQMIQSLGEGETLLDTLTLTTTDGTTAEVQITIRGADDQADVGGDAAGSVVVQRVFSTSGSLSITDVDRTDDPVFEDVAPVASDNGYGQFEMNSGVWTYTLDSFAPAMQLLGLGDVVEDSIEFTASDGTKSKVVVTIFGTTEAGALGFTQTPGATQDNTPSLTDIVAVAAIDTDTDVDSADSDDSTSVITTAAVAGQDANAAQPSLTSEETLDGLFSAVLEGPLPGIASQSSSDSTISLPLDERERRSDMPAAFVAPSEALLRQIMLSNLDVGPLAIEDAAPLTLVEQLAQQEALRQVMENVREETRSYDELERTTERTIDISLRVGGVALSTGSLAWLLRGAGLFASALTSVPAWKGFDPLPVLTRKKRKYVAAADDDIAGEDGDSEAAVGRVLDNIGSNSTQATPAPDHRDIR